MAKQKDRHLEAPGEANRDKHINFVAEENGDVDPADEDVNNDVEDDDAANNEDGEDNGFFTEDDEDESQKKERHDESVNSASSKPEKATPLSWDNSETLADKITITSDNEDILTPVVDDDKKPYIQDDDQAQ